MRTEIIESKAKCPKCKSGSLFLIEEWAGHTIQWEQIDGKFDREDGSLEPGDPLKVEARCKKCGHWWKIRGATQILDVIKQNP